MTKNYYLLESYDEILDRFNPIHLEEMDEVKLMSRIDTKYVFNFSQLSALLNSAASDYQVLEIGKKRIMGYENLYFDTVDHAMYLNHHNQKLNRHKIRIRHYMDTGGFFLEVKFKNNKARTEKQRIPVTGFQSLTEPASREFVSDRSPFSVDLLEPKLTTSFERISLVDQGGKERITLDISLKLYNSTNTLTIPYLVIAEVKNEQRYVNKGFSKLLQENRIFPKRISKYCLGTNLLYPDVKYNRFKTKILYLNKLDQYKQYDKLFSAII